MAGNARPRILDDEFDFNAADLSKQFEQLLRVRRLNELEEQARTPRSSSPGLAPRHTSHTSTSPFPQSPNSQPSSAHPSSRPSQHQPPTYTSFRSFPIVPSPPQDAASLKFRNLLLTLSMTPTKYENPGLLDEALTHVPIDRIYAEAEEEHNLMKAMAASKGDNVKTEWGYQDCVIRSLLRYAVYLPNRWFLVLIPIPGGSNAHSSHSSTILPAHDVMEPLSLKDKLLLLLTKSRVEPPKSNFTDVQILAARPLRDFLDTPKSGHCLRPEEDAQENLPTASACCVVRPAPESGGSGTVKIMCGLRSTVSTREGGSMLTLVKRCGIIRGSTPKVRRPRHPLRRSTN